MTITFDDINIDCVVCILSFLTVEEMNDATLINGLFNEARNDPSLNQTRTATLVIKSKFLYLHETIASKGWARRFFGENSNKTHLRIIGIDNIKGLCDVSMAELRSQSVDVQLQSITSLDVSISPRTHDGEIEGVLCILPNLRELDMTNVRQHPYVLQRLVRKFPQLTCIKWSGNHMINTHIMGRRDLNPRLTSLNPVSLTELSVDGTAFFGYYNHAFSDVQSMFDEDMSNHISYLFNGLPRLERISMMNATWSVDEDSKYRRPISQEMLIKLVRHHPTLRWLRSDLTDEKIAMLKAERPEVTCVNT